MLKRIKWGVLAGVAIAMGLGGYGILALSHMKPTHLLRVTRNDPELQAAIDRARKGLDGFIESLQAPKPDQRFAVKGTFPTSAGPEYLWVRSPEFKNGKFSGKLDQQPIALPGVHKGDPVSFPKKDAVDWLIKDDRGVQGAFTEQVLAKQGSG